MTEEKLIKIVRALETFLNRGKSHDEVLSCQNFHYLVIPSTTYDEKGNGHHSIIIEKSCTFFKDAQDILQFSYAEFGTVLMVLHSFEEGIEGVVSFKATTDASWSLIIPQFQITFQ